VTVSAANDVRYDAVNIEPNAEPECTLSPTSTVREWDTMPAVLR
jgi:hypothetical protein